jgi:hypothetical protein
MKNINKHFVSKLDQHFAEFDATHKHSQAQLDEIAKYKKIYEQRDNPNTAEAPTEEDLWA